MKFGYRLFFSVLIIFSISISSAGAYSASCYGYDVTSDSKPWPQEVNSVGQCNNAKEILNDGGYTSSCHTDSSAGEAYNQMYQDNIFL